MSGVPDKLKCEVGCVCGGSVICINKNLVRIARRGAHYGNPNNNQKSRGMSTDQK